MCHIHLSHFTNLMQVGLGTLEVRFLKIWNRRRALIFWGIWFLEIWLCCAMLICSVVSDCLLFHGLQPARCLCPWRFSRQEYWSGLPCPAPGDLPNPGIKLRSPTLQADSLPSEPTVKPKNIGVGSLSLLQGIFSSQEWNQGLLHCRWILFQLGSQGSPSSYTARNVSSPQ